MPHRAVWRGVLHSIGLAPLLELREVEEAKRLALEAAIQHRAKTSDFMAMQREKMQEVERCARKAMQEHNAREAMQRQVRTEPNRDGDPHDF
jgi:pimeloyl-CoA synthetase